METETWSNKLLLCYLVFGLFSCGSKLSSQDSKMQSNAQACGEPRDNTSDTGPNFSASIDALSSFSDILVEAYDLDNPTPKWSNALDRVIFNLWNRPESKLSRAASLLKVSVIEDSKQGINVIETKLLEKKTAINWLENRMVDLPETTNSIPAYILELFGRPQSDSAARAEIEKLQAEIDTLVAEKDDFAIVAQSNINFALQTCFSQDQVRLLLLGKEGDTFVQAVSIFKNYSRVVSQIKSSITSIDNPTNEVRKKYQGAYLSLIATLRYAQMQYVKISQEQQEKIDKTFIPGILKKIEQDHRDLETFTNACPSQGGCDSAIEQIKSNITGREYTIAVAEKYISYLKSKELVFQTAYMDLAPVFVAAKSTYTMLADANTLAAAMKTSITLFSQLDSIEMPELDNLNLDLIEFEKISAQLF